MSTGPVILVPVALAIKPASTAMVLRFNTVTKAKTRCTQVARAFVDADFGSM